MHLGVCCVLPFAHWSLLLLSAVLSMHACVSYVQSIARCLGVACFYTKSWWRRHPLNAEPPLPVLMSKGFITPSALHYVRNHGAVPKLDWDTHRISVGGMVDRPATFSIPELLELLPSYTIPVTLVCAGAAPPQRNQQTVTQSCTWFEDTAVHRVAAP